MNNVVISIDAFIASVTINRPDKLNALNHETVRELQQGFAELRDNPDVRVVVLQGAGHKAFVAGADISELTALSPIEAAHFSRVGQDLMETIEKFPKPVIAAVQGFALGGGCELAMACHLRIASEQAVFGQPEIKLGLIPGFGGTQRLLRLAGRAATLELCMLGGNIDANRAYQLGVVNTVVPHENLQEVVQKWATKLARSATHAIQATIDAVIRAGEAPLETALDYETQLFAKCCATADMKEGTRAFLEKRKPVFKGE